MSGKQLIADRYELKKRIGTGGMSTVQLALDTRLEREVAIKLLAEHLADDPAFISRFQREALAAARLIHPNIVQVYDSGFDKTSHRHYIVMEYVPGQTCATILRDHGALTPEDAVDIAVQACRGLDYAHRHGVVHRDVKPGNLLRSNDGVIKLADFGIALAAEQSRITQVGSVLGTAAYLSPEQARGEAASPASDFYALGVVVYQLLCGRLPYEAPSLAELTLMREEQPPTPIKSLCPDISDALADTVQKALAIDPKDRFNNGHEFEDALINGLHGIANPSTAATKFNTAATGILSSSEAATAATVAVKKPTRVPRQPRKVMRDQAPAGGTQIIGNKAGKKPATKPPKKKRSGLKAFMTLIFLSAAVVGGYLIYDAANKTTDEAVRLRNVIESNVSDSIDSMKQLIRDNTQN